MLVVSQLAVYTVVCAKSNMPVILSKRDGSQVKTRIKNLMVFEGLEKRERSKKVPPVKFVL